MQGTALNNNSQDTPDQWLEIHGDALYRYALVRLRDADKAEEAVQDTLVAALQAYSRFNGGAAVRTWLIGILKHKILDHFRREARTAHVNLSDHELAESDLEIVDEYFAQDGHWREVPSDWGDPEEAAERSQLLEILQRCLDGLPERLGRLFIMRELMEESTEAICQEMKISPTNAWTMLYRARLELRQCLDRNGAGHT